MKKISTAWVIELKQAYACPYASDICFPSVRHCFPRVGRKADCKRQFASWSICSLPGSPEAVPIALGCGWAEVSDCPLSWQYSLAIGCFMVKCYRYRMNYGALTNVAYRFLPVGQLTYLLFWICSPTAFSR